MFFIFFAYWQIERYRHDKVLLKWTSASIFVSWIKNLKLFLNLFPFVGIHHDMSRLAMTKWQIRKRYIRRKKFTQYFNIKKLPTRKSYHAFIKFYETVKEKFLIISLQHNNIFICYFSWGFQFQQTGSQFCHVSFYYKYYSRQIQFWFRFS